MEKGNQIIEYGIYETFVTCDEGSGTICVVKELDTENRRNTSIRTYDGNNYQTKKLALKEAKRINKRLKLDWMFAL